jgi:hypothetical protein
VEDVDPTPALGDRGDHFCDGVGIGNIGLPGGALASFGRE